MENPDSQKVLIVDPGDSPLEIERQIDEIDGDPEAILLTHGHFDHMLAADALRKKYHIPVYVHEKEQHLLGDPKENLSGLWSKPYTMQADKTVKEGDVLHLADFEIHVLATPGHTDAAALVGCLVDICRSIHIIFLLHIAALRQLQVTLRTGKRIAFFRYRNLL